MLAALHDAPVYRRVAGLVPASLSAELATLLLLTLPDDLWSPLPGPVREELRELLAPERQPAELRAEVEHLRRQLADLCALDGRAVCDRCAAAP